MDKANNGWTKEAMAKLIGNQSTDESARCSECNATDDTGTGYCAEHLARARERAASKKRTTPKPVARRAAPRSSARRRAAADPNGNRRAARADRYADEQMGFGNA